MVENHPSDPKKTPQSSSSVSASSSSSTQTLPQSHASTVPPLLDKLPGHPIIPFSSFPAVIGVLRSDLPTVDLDTMSPHLWMMSTKSSSNINAFHAQLVKGRSIIPSEDPRLHLVWLDDRIFVKPLPKYLMSCAFWNKHLCSPVPIIATPDSREIVGAALGLLRTYSHLIRHEVDLRIAQRDDLQLLPNSITWEAWCGFSDNIAYIADKDVTPRYHFGELRLSRLNFYCKFLLGRFWYERVHTQYGSYFAQYYAPALFVFGFASVALSALQVELAVEGIRDGGDGGAMGETVDLRSLARGLSRAVLVWLAVLGLGFACVFLWMFVNEWAYAIRHRNESARRIRRESWKA